MAQATLDEIAPPLGSVWTRCAAVSSDGTTIVGDAWSSISRDLFTATAGGPAQVIAMPAGLYFRKAVDISGNGSVVVGELYTSPTSLEHGFRWSAAQGFQVLSPLNTVWNHGPSVGSWVHDASAVLGLSADGSTVVGMSSNGHAFTTLYEGAPERAVTWSGGFAQDLGTLLAPLPLPMMDTHFGSSYALPRGISASGNTVLLLVESAQYQGVTSLCTGSSLSPLTTTELEGTCSDDGSVLLRTSSGFARRSVLGVWSSFPETQWVHPLFSVNRDATRAIGVDWVWSTTGGVVLLSDYLTANSIDTSNWSGLVATDVSADGRTFVGYGSHNGQLRGFVCRIPFLMEMCDATDWASSLPPFVLSRDLSDPRRKGEPRKGVCADGVSQLVIRCTVDAPGVFRASFLATGSVPDQGQLGSHGVPFSLSGPVVATTVPVGTSGRHDVEFLYKAPLDFARSPTALEAVAPDPTRPVGIRLEFQEQGTSTWRYLNATVQVRRPPVVAAHGLWSGPATWLGAFTSFETDPRFQWRKLDYERTNFLSLSENSKLVGEQVLQETRTARESGFACSQVDWVGHSMGGLLPRAYYALSKQRRGLAWGRRDNFGAGDLHKLILLNSPQHGSPWANLLCEWADAPVWGTLLRAALSWRGYPIGGAVQDLAEGSDALARVGTTPVPSLAVIGIGGSARVTETVTALGSQAAELMRVIGTALPEPWGPAIHLLSLARLDAQPPLLGVDDVYGRSEHDLVVLEASQRAGLHPSYASTAFNPPITGPSSLHHQNTSTPEYAARVLDLLHTPVAAFAPELPEPELNPLDWPMSGLPEVVQGGLVLANSPPHVIGSSLVHLTVTGSGGFVPVSVTVFTPWGVIAVPQAPFVVSVPVGVGAAGPASFVAIGRDAGGGVGVSSGVTVNLGTPGTLTSLSAWPAQVILRAPFEQAFLRIEGAYSGGIVRSIGEPAFGTTFTVSPPGVASVSSEGVVTALRPGVASVTAANGTHATSIDVVVEIDAVTGYGDGVAGSGNIFPEIGITGGFPVLGNGAFGVTASRVLGGAVGFFIAGWDVAELPVLGGTLWVDPRGAILRTVLCNGGVGAPGEGACTTSVPIPGSSAWLGIRIHWQAAFLDPQGPQGLSFTNGLITSIVP